MSKLYVVGTPIGNLSDMSPRALEVLGSVDFIAAEDTRVTMKLLSHFDIHKPLVSYYEHNLREKGEYILGRIMNGETCAIVTDAGMPCISDPGEDLVKLCAEHGVEVNVVPSPTAAMSALAISGLSTSRFSFEGFLPQDKKERESVLKEMKTSTRTMILYEAPHRLARTLTLLAGALGEERPISLCRELTKKFETVTDTTVGGALKALETVPARGEYVLVIAGRDMAEAAAERAEAFSEIPLAEHVASYEAQGMTRKEAMKAAAKDRGMTRREVYQALL